MGNETPWSKDFDDAGGTFERVEPTVPHPGAADDIGGRSVERTRTQPASMTTESTWPVGSPSFGSRRAAVVGGVAAVIALVVAVIVVLRPTESVLNSSIAPPPTDTDAAPGAEPVAATESPETVEVAGGLSVDGFVIRTVGAGDDRRQRAVVDFGTRSATTMTGDPAPSPSASLVKIAGGDSDGGLWTARQTAAGVEVERSAISTTAAGYRTEPDLYPDTRLLGNDGRGNVVLEGIGGVYVVEPGGVSLLTTGTLLAIGPDTAFVRECDELLRCANVSIDRSTGEREPASVTAQIIPVGPRLGPNSLATIAPGGAVSFVRVGDEPPSWQIVDLTDGMFTSVPAPDSNAQLAWSADASSVAWVSDSTVYRATKTALGAWEVVGHPELGVVADLRVDG